MIAGKPVNFGNLSNVFETSKASPLFDTGVTATKSGTASKDSTSSSSFQQSASIFSNILGGAELPETFRESVTSTNLINLGKASVDISNALNTVASGLQTQINQVKPMANQLVPSSAPAEEQPLPFGGILKSSLTSGFDKAAQTIGISSAALGIILLGIGGFVLIRSRH